MKCVNTLRRRLQLTYHTLRNGQGICGGQLRCAQLIYACSARSKDNQIPCLLRSLWYVNCTRFHKVLTHFTKRFLPDRFWNLYHAAICNTFIAGINTANNLVHTHILLTTGKLQEICILKEIQCETETEYGDILAPNVEFYLQNIVIKLLSYSHIFVFIFCNLYDI